MAMADSQRTLRAIFDEASEMPPGEQRRAWLDQACGGDAALRANVEGLLRSQEEAGGFLADLKHDASVAATQVTEREGDRLGRYKLLQKIGEGDCGVVYMAEQTEPVRRRVALKVIKLGMDTRSVIARFEAERQALAMMDHVNIARVLDAGATNTGRPFFVMELVRGIKITDYCEQSSLSTTARLRLFIQVCQAVQHAHHKGIIHRDLKPSNILVTSDDGVPLTKVIDFGIAKATADIQLTDKTLFTRFEMFIGTPAYMSPEQAEFNASDIDTRTDIYALGVLLYELLTGQTPFDTTTLLSSGLDAMRKTIRETEPPRPSTRLTQELAAAELKGQTAEGAGDSAASRRLLRLKETVQQLRGDLDWIIQKVLEKDRNRRYETANGLAMDIQLYLANEPVVARPPSTAYKIQKARQRNKLAFTAAAAVALALLVGTAVSTWQAVRATRARQESEAITEFLTGLMQSPDPARDGRTVTVVEALGKGLVNLERDLANQPARRARLQFTLGATYKDLGMPLEAIHLLEQAWDYYRARSGPKHLDTLGVMNALAEAYRRVGRQAEALKLGGGGPGGSARGAQIKPPRDFEDDGIAGLRLLQPWPSRRGDPVCGAGTGAPAQGSWSGSPRHAFSHEWTRVFLCQDGSPRRGRQIG
jgi:serine/threonine protein kinase